MKKNLIAFCIFLPFLQGCGKKEVHEMPPELEMPPVQTEYEKVSKSLNQVWVMSSNWAGYMGAAIGLSTNKYYYWFYSDVGNPDAPIYPVSGDYTFDGEMLVLKGNEGAMLSNARIISENGGRNCLWAKKDIGDLSRLLIPDPIFDSTDPFKNQRILKAEPSP